MIDLDKPPPWSKTHMNYADWAEQMIEWQEQAIEQLRAENGRYREVLDNAVKIREQIEAERDEARKWAEHVAEAWDRERPALPTVAPPWKQSND